MTASDVVVILQLLAQAAIDVCVDGGWGVDALLGEQTRPHEDLDIAIQHKDAAQIRAVLGAKGYQEVPRDDSWECNFVLGDDLGHLVDVHTYAYDSAGNFVYGLQYPLDSLNGTGSINGYLVKCITAEWLIKFHTGYKLDENDYHDVKVLCQRFGIAMPGEYEGYARKDGSPGG
jgi:lincosamide nucleotidyltransferase A/C/D/E